VVRVRHGRGHTLRRNATRTAEIDERWAEIEVPYQPGTTERDVVALGTHAVAVSPPELVAGVRAALQAVATAQAGSERTGDLT
jgi:proteasome accessory factor B